MLIYFVSVILSLFIGSVESAKFKLPDLSSISIAGSDEPYHLNIKVNGTNLLVVTAREVDDIELISVLSVLRKAKINTQFTGLKNSLQAVILEYGLSILPDVDIDIAKEERPYDLILLPGGKGYVNYLYSPVLAELLREQDGASRFIAFMSTAPLVMEHLKIGAGRHITFCPTWKSLFGAEYTVHDIGVVQDGHILTCQGPSSALEFAFYLVELFEGKAKADQIAEMISYKRNLSDILIVNPQKHKPIFHKTLPHKETFLY